MFSDGDSEENRWQMYTRFFPSFLFCFLACFIGCASIRLYNSLKPRSGLFRGRDQAGRTQHHLCLIRQPLIAHRRPSQVQWRRPVMTRSQSTTSGLYFVYQYTGALILAFNSLCSFAIDTCRQLQDTFQKRSTFLHYPVVTRSSQLLPDWLLHTSTMDPRRKLTGWQDVLNDELRRNNTRNTNS